MRKPLWPDLGFPFSQVAREILHILEMAPTELKAGAWRHVVACSVAWPMVLGDGQQLTAPEFLNLFSPVKYGYTWTLQGRERKFFSAPTTWQSNPRFETSFFFVSGLGWELPPILWDRLPEARVPRHWGDSKSKRGFQKPKLTAAQQDRVDRMVAWSTVSVEAEGEDSNLGFLLRPANLQKYLGFSAHRCGGMAHIPDMLFPSKKKGKAEGTPRRTRSKGPSLAPVKEAEPSSSSEEGSVSLSLSTEGDSPRGDAPQVVEGPIVLDDSQDDDEDNVPLMARTRVPKRKVVEPSGEEEADSSPLPNEGGAESPTYSEFIKMYPPTKKARGVVVLFAGEGSVPSTEAIPSTEGDEDKASSPSIPPSARARSRPSKWQRSVSWRLRRESRPKLSRPNRFLFPKLRA
jgi:hypothetical protein